MCFVRALFTDGNDGFDLEPRVATSWLKLSFKELSLRTVCRFFAISFCLISLCSWEVFDDPRVVVGSCSDFAASITSRDCGVLL